MRSSPRTDLSTDEFMPMRTRTLKQMHLNQQPSWGKENALPCSRNIIPRLGPGVKSTVLGKVYFSWKSYIMSSHFSVSLRTFSFSWDVVCACPQCKGLNKILFSTWDYLKAKPQTRTHKNLLDVRIYFHSLPGVSSGLYQISWRSYPHLLCALALGKILSGLTVCIMNPSLAGYIKGRASLKCRFSILLLKLWWFCQLCTKT